MIGGVANFFGYTNVPNQSDVAPFKPMPFQLASTSISEPVLKLSLQPKQEIAVGSSYAGGDDLDQLSIDHIVKRESFLCGVLWTTSNNAGDLLFYSGVNPGLYDFDLTKSSVQHTPMSYLSQMFEFWRGPIIFRFKVVRSQYHRGRLNIAWDNSTTLVNVASDVPNVGDPSVMNVVMDLDQTDEVEVEIPYVQAKPFLRSYCNGKYSIGTKCWENSGTLAVTSSGEWNGCISMKVMNRLTAPEASSDVDVLVFVRAGDDFKFAAPAQILSNWSHSNKQTAVLQSEKIYTLGKPGIEDDDVYRQVFGEKIVSLREVLHRSSLAAVQVYAAVSSTISTTNFVWPIKRYPRPPGVYNNAWETAVISAANVPCNFTRMHPINWILPMFIGYKGSVNVTLNTCGGKDGFATEKIAIHRLNSGPSLTAAQRRLDYWTSTGTMSFKMQTINDTNRYDPSGIAGSALTNSRTNAGLCANLPYYNNGPEFKR